MIEIEAIFKKIEIFFWIIQIIWLIFRFLPIFIALFYNKFTRWLFIITIIFGWTPLPRIILIMNYIEENPSTIKIKQNQENLNKKINILYEKNKEKRELFQELFIKLKKDQENKENR